MWPGEGILGICNRVAVDPLVYYFQRNFDETSSCSMCRRLWLEQVGNEREKMVLVKGGGEGEGGAHV